MKCPKCGAEWSDGSLFCGECGTRVPKKPKRVVKAILASILFIAIFLTAQTAVLTAYEMALTANDEELIEVAQEYTFAFLDPTKTVEELNAIFERYEKAITPVIEALNDHAMILTLIADLAALLVFCLIFRIRRREPIRELKIRPINPLRLLTFALFGAAFSIVISYGLTFIPFSESFIAEYNAMLDLTSGAGEPVAVRVITTVIVVPIVEEIVFRVLVMRNLKPELGRGFAVVFSSLAFALAHFSFSLASLISFGYALIAGVVFALIFDKYDSAIPTIVCHMAFNLMEFVPTADKANTVRALFAIAAAVAVFCIYRIFFRYPVFSDVLFDMNNIEPINDEEKEIFDRIREIKSGTEEVDRDEIDAITKAWEDNRAAYKENKKHNPPEDR